MPGRGRGRDPKLRGSAQARANRQSPTPVSITDVLAGLFATPAWCHLGLHDWVGRRLETLDTSCWPTRSEQPHAGEDWRETDNYYVVTGSVSLGYPRRVEVCERCDVLHHRRLMRDDATTVRKAKYAFDRLRPFGRVR